MLTEGILNKIAESYAIGLAYTEIDREDDNLIESLASIRYYRDMAGEIIREGSVVNTPLHGRGVVVSIGGKYKDWDMVYRIASGDEHNATYRGVGRHIRVLYSQKKINDTVTDSRAWSDITDTDYDEEKGEVVVGEMLQVVTDLYEPDKDVHPEGWVKGERFKVLKLLNDKMLHICPLGNPFLVLNIPISTIGKELSRICFNEGNEDYDYKDDPDTDLEHLLIAGDK